MKQGFALAHWMIYCALMVLLSVLTYALIAQWHHHVQRLHTLCNRVLPIHVALDMFKKDIMQAVRIHNQGVEQCSLMNSYCRITWRVEDGSLMRTASHYDAREQRWKKPSSSLLAQHIDDCSFQPLYSSTQKNQKEPYGVRVTLRQAATTVNQIGYMRNGNYAPRS